MDGYNWGRFYMNWLSFLEIIMFCMYEISVNEKYFYVNIGNNKFVTLNFSYIRPLYSVSFAIIF